MGTVLTALNRSSYGGAWRLLLNFPQDWPERPPEVIFATPILHLNVGPSGR